MSTTFSRSMRSLERDGFRFTLTVLLIAALLLVAWGVWFFLATVPVYTVIHTFDLDVNSGSTHIVVELEASEAANVRPQQKAWIRLTGARALPATVTRVVNEPLPGGDGKTRVELALEEGAGSILSEQNNLQGRVEIEVERLTPSALALRSIGRD